MRLKVNVGLMTVFDFLFFYQHLSEYFIIQHIVKFVAQQASAPRMFLVLLLFSQLLSGNVDIVVEFILFITPDPSQL